LRRVIGSEAPQANGGSLPSGVFGPSYYRSPRREALARGGTASPRLERDPADRDRRTALEKPYLRMRCPSLYSALTAAPAHEAVL